MKASASGFAGVGAFFCVLPLAGIERCVSFALRNGADISRGFVANQSSLIDFV